MESDTACLDPQPADLARRLGKLLIVSPHLDDAVFACGDLMQRNPGGMVVTVFAGGPSAAQPLTAWDRLCGFHDGVEAMTVRKEEDALALFLLEAVPAWLDFLDAQYAAPPPVQEVAAALWQIIAANAPDVVLFPLGLFHSDHELVSAAVLQLCRRRPQLVWLAYADALYRTLPAGMQTRMEALRAEGWALEPLAPPAATGAKRRAVDCYASQLRALAQPGHVAPETVFAPEQYWRVRSID